MKLPQLGHVLVARRRLFLGVLGVAVACALLVSLLSPNMYVATASLVVDAKTTDVLTGATQTSASLASALATQVDVIASRNVALKVVNNLHLADDPDIRREFEKDAGGVGSIQDWLADRLLGGLKVIPSRQSSVISIEYSARSADAAAQIANAFAQAYVQTSLELKIEPATRQAIWFEEQLQGLRGALQLSQQRLAQEQRETSLVGTDDRLDIEGARLGEVSSQLVQAQGVMYDAQTRLAQMNAAVSRNRLAEMPDIVGNSLLQSMKANLTRAEGRLAEVSARYGVNHPQHVSAAAEVRTLRARLLAELETAKGSVGQAVLIAQQKVAELQRAFDGQKERILTLKEERDSVALLNRDVESAQRAYDNGLQRASQVKLESQLNQSTVAMLNTAIAPLWPARPRVPMNLLLGLLLGAIAATAITIAAELLDRRVRTYIDLMDTGIPVLAEVPRLGVESPRFRLPGRSGEPAIAAGTA